jgi:hypothetical protein
MIKYYILSFVLVFALFSCTKHELNSEDNKEFPLKLSIIPSTNGGLEVSWDAVNINGFQEYTLVRQVDSTFFNPQTDTSWVIDDYKKTRITDRNIPLSQRIFYHLTAKSQTRTLESALVAHERADILLFSDILFTQIIANPTLNLVYLYSRSPATIRIIDLSKKTMSDAKTLAFSAGSSQTKLICNSESAKSLFITDYDAMYHYDAKTLELLTFIAPNNPDINTISSVAMGNNLIYLAQTDAYKGIDVIEPKTGVLLEKGVLQDPFFTSSSKSIRYFSKLNQVILFDNNSSSKDALAFSLLNDGKVGQVAKISKTNTGSFSGINLAVAPDGSSYVSPSTGELFSSEHKKLTTFLGNSSTAAYTYSPDGKYIAYRNFNNLVKVIELATLKEVLSIKVQTTSSITTFRFNSFYLTNDNLEVITTRLNSINFTTNDLSIFKTKYR